MKIRVVLVCTALVGCQIDSSDDALDSVDLEAIAKQEKVTICHKPGAHEQTLEVAGPAVNAHLGHGDYLGACQPIVCAAGSTTSCYGGPTGTEGVGTCSAGAQTCNVTGTGYGACVGSVEPTDDVCGDGLDNDCDGVADEDCVCAAGSQASCYTGPAGTEGVGTCSAGAQTCNATGTGYGACVGSVEPTTDVCGDGLDTDCDGVADEDCVCAAGSQASCYTGPAGTEGVGTCSAGAQTCNATGTAYGACVGSVEPTTEVCGDGLDNDCDGSIDDGCAPVCVPTSEVCGDGVDNDCDGLVDERCLGDRAWNDRNQNGVQDAGETGLGGATFILRTMSGSLVAVAVSNAAGMYYFGNIPPGQYYAEVIPPFNYALTANDVGADTLDSDFEAASGATAIFTVTTNGTNFSIDAGFYFVIQS